MSITELAKITGYSVQHVSNILNGHVDSERGKKLIAKAMKKDFFKLWGDEPDSNFEKKQ